MTALRVLVGIVAGFGIAFASVYLAMHVVLGVNNAAALVVAAVAGAIGAVYSAIAFGRNIYGLRFFSILGYILDMSWSLLNSTASLVVWLPACLIAGGDFIPPDDNSRRSGTFVYQKNPRGAAWGATTVGTVIAGGWSSHEETHVWQARMFGPVYMLVYGLSWVLNLLFRLCTGKTTEMVVEAYYRICFEDWAYSAGSASQGESNINWGQWVLWLFLTSVYVACIVLIFVGAFAKIVLLSVFAALGLVIYNLIRAFTPRTA